MSDRRHHWLQPSAARKHAVPIVTPSAGGPLIKSTPNTGWMLEKRAASFTVDAEAVVTDKQKRHAENIAMKQFIEEEARLDGAKFFSKRPYQATWHPAVNYQPPNIQKGDRGGQRPVARSLAQDVDYSKMACRLEAWFIAPEYINEIPTSLAMELFTKPGGRPGLKPLREKDWRWSQQR